MKQPSNRLVESNAWPVHRNGGPFGRWAAVAALLGASGFSCTEASQTPSSADQAGSGGQGTAAAGAGGSAVMAGASGTTTGGGGGTPPVAGGSAGAAGLAGGGAGGGGGAAGSGGAGGGGGVPDDGWVPLFNGTNLDGWTVHGTTETLFTVADGVIHVYPTQQDQSDQPQANMVHETVLGGKYTLHVEYKWAEARFGGRKQTERDAGILFHIQGDLTQVWPDSIECQIGSSPVRGEWVTGDLWVLGQPMTAQTVGEDGQLDTYGSYQRSYASAQAELPHGQWNVVEVIVDGAEESLFMVNGVQVNRVVNMKHNGQPLTEGRVSVQAEYAEMYYRDIRYKVAQ